MIWKCQSNKNKMDASKKYSGYSTEEYQTLII